MASGQLYVSLLVLLVIISFREPFLLIRRHHSVFFHTIVSRGSFVLIVAAASVDVGLLMEFIPDALAFAVVLSWPFSCELPWDLFSHSV